MKIYILALITFVLFLSTQVGVPVLPGLSSELGANPQATAAVLSSALMTVVLLQFFSGILADRYGRRRVLVLGAALGGVTSLLCVIAPSWQALLLLRILGGVADAIAMPALLGLTAEIAGNRQGTFFGILRSAQGLSFLVAPALGGWLSLYSLRTPFAVDGLLSLAACVLLFVLVKQSPQRGARHAFDLKGIAAVFSQPRVYAFALFVVVDCLSFPVLAAFVPVKAQGLGSAPWQIALILAIEAIGFSLASLLVGRLSDRYGRRPFAIIAQPMVILACLGLALSSDLTGLVAAYSLFGLGSGMTYLTGLVMMADVTPPEGAATTLGMFDSAIDLTIFLAPAVAIPLSGWLGTNAVLALAGVGAMAALPVAVRVAETRPRAKGTAG